MSKKLSQTQREVLTVLRNGGRLDVWHGLSAVAFLYATGGYTSKVGLGTVQALLKPGYLDVIDARDWRKKVYGISPVGSAILDGAKP